MVEARPEQPQVDSDIQEALEKAPAQPVED